MNSLSPQGRWEKPCSDLYELLTMHGAGAMLDAFTRCVARSKFTVDQRYLARKPMVFTTNKKLRAWGDVLHDHDLAEVILDRVLERGQHIILRGSRSFRTQHLDPETLTSGGDAEPEGVRESGNTRQPARP